MHLYRDVDSVLHRLNPATKLVALGMLFVGGMTFNDPRYVLGALAAVLTIAAAGRALPSVGRMWKLLVLLFVFATGLWSLFLRSATSGVDSLPLVGTGIEYALAMGLRIDVLLVASIVFVSCTRVEELSLGLQRLGIPYRMCFAISLAFRLLPTFSGSVSTIVQAQMSRGLDLTRGNVLTRIRRYLPLIVPALVSALRNADTLAMALESRGLGARPTRTSLIQPKPGPADILAICIVAVALAWCVAARQGGYGEVLPRL